MAAKSSDVCVELALADPSRVNERGPSVGRSVAGKSGTAVVSSQWWDVNSRRFLHRTIGSTARLDRIDVFAQTNVGMWIKPTGVTIAPFMSAMSALEICQRRQHDTHCTYATMHLWIGTNLAFSANPPEDGVEILLFTYA